MPGVAALKSELQNTMQAVARSTSNLPLLSHLSHPRCTFPRIKRTCLSFSIRTHRHQQVKIQIETESKDTRRQAQAAENELKSEKTKNINKRRQPLAKLVSCGITFFGPLLPGSFTANGNQPARRSRPLQRHPGALRSGQGPP